MKASNNAERIGKVFGWTKEARGKIGWDPKETPGKRGELRKSRWTPEKQGTFKTPEKQEELRKSLVFFRKYQEKEKTSKKAGEHQKREELFSGTGKTGRASGKSGEAKEKSGVSFSTPKKEGALVQHQENVELSQGSWWNGRKHRKKMEKHQENVESQN